MTTPRTILVPIDLADHPREVLDYAAALADKLDARLHVRHAVTTPLIGAELPAVVTDQAMSDIIADRRTELEMLIAVHAGKARIASAEVETGEPHAVIIESAERLHADLILMGTHGRRGVSRLLLGSIAERVARTAPCPVLLVRAKPTAAPPG